jgi:hypothetical protein
MSVDVIDSSVQTDLEGIVGTGVEKATKADIWNLIVANTVIPRTINDAVLTGIAITTAGTCIAIDGQTVPVELPLSNFSEGFYPILPTKLKTGLTAIVYAVYKA